MLTARILTWLLNRSGQPYVFHPVSDPAFLPAQLPAADFGLYVHIPFCRQLCAFCPYCKTVYREEQARAYMQALLSEIDLVAERHDLTEQKLTVTGLYFGGGTPALLAEHLIKIIDRLREYYDIRGGIGIELHPDDIGEATLNTLAQAGFSMISIGVQSFCADTLDKLQRRPADHAEADQSSADQSRADLSAKMALVRNFGFKVIDVDLIFGIRGQTACSLEQDIRKAFASGATQVSTYPLIRFSYTQPFCRPVKPFRQRRLLTVLEKTSRQLALDRTAVWTFNKPGLDTYTSVTRPAYLGFGVSAVSVIGSDMVINTFSVDNYIWRLTDSRPAAALHLAFSARQLALYVLFWQAYKLCLDEADFRERTGQDMSVALGRELQLARLMGWIVRQPDQKGYRLTRRGVRLYHEVEQVVTHAFLDPLWRKAGQIPDPPEIILL
jgi:oxygen-independent coproporphyrinogen-3 oxidase